MSFRDNIKTNLTDKEWRTILDVLNVYDPNDIAHVYPEMSSPEFVQDVTSAFHKVRKLILRLNELDGVALDHTESGLTLTQEELDNVHESSFGAWNRN
jgi:hypothetical protein